MQDNKYAMPDALAQIHQLAAGPAAQGEADSALPHVLLVLDGFAKTLGGGERVVLRMAALLPRYGFRASILTFAFDTASEFRLAAAPCPVYLLPLKKTYNLSAWRGAAALRTLIRQQNICLVQTFFESADLWAGFFTRVLTPAKLIWSRRDMGILREPKHAKAYRLLRRMPHAVAAVSEQVRQHAIQVDGIDPERVHTIHNGFELTCDTVENESHATAGQPSHVTTVGNVRRVKGHDLFIRAAALVVQQFPQTRFSIAGEVLDKPYHAELCALIAELHLGDHMRFAGRVTDLSTHLRHADIFVLPSRSEGFSNALVEAMAIGLPAVATDVGGNGEALQDGKTGLLVAPENAQELGAAILYLLSNPDMAHSMAVAGQNAMKTHFTADAMVQKTTALYRVVLDDK